MNNEQQKELLQQYVDTNQNEYFDRFKDFAFENWYRKTKNVYAGLKEDPFQKTLDDFKKYIEKKENGLKNINNIQAYFTMCLKNKGLYMIEKEEERHIKTTLLNETNEVIVDNERDLTREEIAEIFAYLLKNENKKIPEKCKKIFRSLLNENEDEIRDELIEKKEIKNKEAYYTQKNVCKDKLKKYFLENYSEICEIFNPKKSNKNK